MLGRVKPELRLMAINPRPHMGDAPRWFSFAVRYIFDASDLIFAIAVFVTFCKVLRKFQASVTFGL